MKKSEVPRHVQTRLALVHHTTQAGIDDVIVQLEKLKMILYRPSQPQKQVWPEAHISAVAADDSHMGGPELMPVGGVSMITDILHYIDNLRLNLVTYNAIVEGVTARQISDDGNTDLL